MSTYISYNGVSLGFIRTLSINQEAVREDSDSDYIYTKITIKVSSLLNRDILIGGINPNPAAPFNSLTPAQQVKKIRAALMSDCGKLRFGIDTDEIFTSPMDGFKEDDKHGPKPLYCNVTRIDGASTMHIEFGVETFIYDQACVGKTAYVSNRWSEAHHVNEHGMTKRTIKGKAIYRGSWIDDKKGDLTGNKGEINTPDTWRGSLIPPNAIIPDGFKRMSFEVTVPQDGLGLEYTIVDEEQYTYPPDSMTKFEAEYTATTSKDSMWSDKVTVRGWSNVVMDKSKMFDDALNIVLAAFDSRTIIQDPATAILWGGSLAYRLHENYIEVTMSRLNAGAIKVAEGLNLREHFQNPEKLNYIGGKRKTVPNAVDDKKDVALPCGVRGSAALGMLAFDRYLGQCLLPSDKAKESPTGNQALIAANFVGPLP